MTALECPGCGAAHPADERFCAECGLPLVHAPGSVEEPKLSEARERARKVRPAYSRGELVKVARARHQAEAELLQQLLLEEGIPSLARRSGGFDVPDFLASGPRDILVPASGAEVARELLPATPRPPAQLGGPPNWVRALAVALAVLLLAIAAAGVLAVAFS
jgi:Putative prokaryotic signal transducing protein